MGILLWLLGVPLSLIIILKLLECSDMPQSTKDSRGGKTHGADASSGKNKTGDGKAKEKSSASSPTGSQGKGEKKSTPH